MIRSILIGAGTLLLAVVGPSEAAAQVPGFPAFGQGPQGPPPASLPGSPTGSLPGSGGGFRAPGSPPAPSGPAVPGGVGVPIQFGPAPGIPGSPTVPAAPPAPPVLPGSDLQLELFEPGKLVAQVGDQPIFYGEILGDLNQIVSREMPDASEFLKDARRKELFGQLLPKMVEQKMVYVDFTRTIPEADKRIPEIEKKLEEGFYGTELPALMKRIGAEDVQQLEEIMRGAGTSLRNVKRSWIEGQIVGFYLSQKFTDDREVTHQEMVDHYREHLSDFAFPARVRWEELMVRIDPNAPPEIALRTIEDMGNEVVFGAPFDAVARRRSQGPTASSGGRHDWTEEGKLEDKELERVLFTMRLDYLSDVIRSADGFRIVRVLEREQGGHRQFRDVQGEIRDAIKANRRKEQVSTYLEELRSNVPVWTILDESTPEPTGALPETAARRNSTRR